MLLAHEMSVMARFAEAQPNDHTMVLQAIDCSEKLCADLQGHMEEHTEDAEAVLTTFERYTHESHTSYMPKASRLVTSRSCGVLGTHQSICLT